MCLSLLPSHMFSKKKKRFLIWWPSLSNTNFKWCRQSPELTSLNHVFLNGFTSDKRLRRYTILLTDGFLSQKVKNKLYNECAWNMMSINTISQSIYKFLETFKVFKSIMWDTFLIKNLICRVCQLWNMAILFVVSATLSTF